MPPLSVVIPTRDTRDLTLCCLASLHAGGHGGEPEVVVVDEASTDGTAAAIERRFPAVRVLVNETARGFSAAANRGLAAARGDLLLLLNSDTEVDPGSLAALAAAFAADPRLGIAGGLLRYPDGRPQWSGGPEPTTAWLFTLASGGAAALGGLRPWRRLRPPSGWRPGPDAAGDGESADPGKPRPVDWVTGAALALRREVWEACGPLDEGYRFYAQDLDLCGAARAAGWAVAIVPGFTVGHHHGASLAAAGDGAPQRPDLLWPDLVRWRRRSAGEAAGRRAARALIVGGRLRLAARRLAAPFTGAASRRRWRREAEPLRRAIAACAAG